MTSVREYLIKKGFEFREVERPSGTNAQMNCPFCDDRERKFAINLEHGAWKCLHENKCGRSGSFWQFQKDLGDDPQRLYTDKSFYKKEKHKTYQKPKIIPRKPESPLIEYFKNRKITPETLKSMGVSQGNEKNVIMMPYYKNNEVVDVKYRRIDSKKMWREKNTESVLYNRDKVIENNYIVITEGEIDCMTWFQFGFPAVSVPSGVDDLRWIENEWDFLEKFHKIYINMDMDDAGRRGLKNIASRLGEYRCYEIYLPKKDANECLVGGADKQYFRQALEMATGFDIDELVTTSYYRDELKKEILKEDLLRGTPTGFTGLDHIIKGWRGGELSIWTGMNGSGKSTLLNQIMSNIINANERVCLGSFEMKPVRVLRWMVLLRAKYLVIREEDIDEIVDYLNEKLFIINMNGVIDKKDLFPIFEFGVRKYGIKHFVLDSMMRIKFSTSNEYQDQTNFVSDLISFGKKYNIHTHLVAHPRKGQKDSQTPGKVDVAGTGNITNLADNVFAVWRMPEDVKEKAKAKDKVVADNILYVKKNREWGIEGKVKLLFNSDKKRFSEMNREDNVYGQNAENTYKDNSNLY